MGNVAVHHDMGSLPAFAPLIARRKTENPPNRQYELWVLSDKGKHYYLFGSYPESKILFKAAEGLIDSLALDDGPGVMDYFDQ